MKQNSCLQNKEDSVKNTKTPTTHSTVNNQPAEISTNPNKRTIKKIPKAVATMGIRSLICLKKEYSTTLLQNKTPTKYKSICVTIETTNIAVMLYFIANIKGIKPIMTANIWSY